MLTPQTTIAIAIAVAAFGAGYWSGDAVQSRATAKAVAAHGADKAAWDEAVAKAEREHAAAIAKAREQETAWRDAAHHSELENAKLKRQVEESGRAADAAARRLRDESSAITAALNRVSADAADARVGLASAAAHAVAECGEALTEVARRHDGCEAERRTLIGAWPRQ
jgi:hypothetical protein